MSRQKSYENTMQCQACFDVHQEEPPIYLLPCGVHTVNFDCLLGLYNSKLSFDSKTEEFDCDAYCPQCRKSSSPIKGNLSNIQIVRKEYVDVLQDSSATQFKCSMCKTSFKSLFDLGVHRKKCNKFPIKCPMQSHHTINDEYKQCNNTIYGRSKESIHKHKYNSCKYAKCKHHKYHIFTYDKIQLHESMCKMTLKIAINGRKMKEMGNYFENILDTNMSSTKNNLDKIKKILVASNKAVKLIEEEFNIDGKSIPPMDPLENSIPPLPHDLLEMMERVIMSNNLFF